MQALTSLVNLHPHASKRLMTQISNQFEMEGLVRWARYKDAVHIGEIRAKALVAVDKLKS